MYLHRLSSIDLSSTHWSYEIEGMVKVQAMGAVEERVLCGLGWPNLNFFKERHMGTIYFKSEVQMFYQFGIFSTRYEQEEMPNWIRHRSAGPSISFTVPSSPNNLRGLNFCYVFKIQPPETNLGCFGFRVLTLITFNNITKNRMWIYELCTTEDNKEQTYVSLSHWMFGMNEMEMECGDSVTIIVTEGCHQFLKECGVSFVYDDGNREEEDALAYYKLRFFQTTGRRNEIRWLNNLKIFLPCFRVFPYYHRIVGDDAEYQEQEEPWFKAFPRSTPDVIAYRSKPDVIAYKSQSCEGKEESSRRSFRHGYTPNAYRKMGNVTTLNKSRETQ